MSTDRVSSVVGAPHRSLFDAVKPRDVAEQGERIRGPGGMALAALRHPGVTGGEMTPADVVLLGGRAFGSPQPGWHQVPEARALAIGYGMASVRSRRTAGGRTWVLLRTSALLEGPALELAALLPTLPPVALCPVVVGPDSQTGRIASLLRGIGVETFVADNDDAWSTLSALDHGARQATTSAVAVLATRTPR